METTPVQKRKVSTANKLLALAFAFLFAMSVLTAAIASNGFTVKITRMNVIGDNGASYSGIMYVPDSVSNENKAPAIIMVHGNSTNALAQTSHAIEYSRRGYIVLSMDIAGRGQSEIGVGLKDAELTPSLVCWINYLTTCPIVDTEQIILSSHSMGGLLCRQAIAQLPGVVDTWVNLGTSSRPEAATEWGINCATFGGSGELKTLEDFYQSFAEMANIDPATVVENQIYEYNGYKFACAVANRTHGGCFWSAESVEDQMDYIQAVNPTGTYIVGSDQVWQLHYATSMLGMAAIILFMIALVNALIQLPVFAIVKQPLPRPICLPKVGYTISVVIAVGVVVLGYGKLATLHNTILPSTLRLFPTTLANGMLTFVMGTTLVSAVMAVLYLKTDAKKQGAKLCDLGLTTAGNTKLCGELIFKSFVIGLIVAVSVFTWMALMEDFADISFQAGPMGLSSITPVRIRIALPYMAIYFINFFMSGFSHNVERRLPSTGNAVKDNVLAMVVNIIIGTLGMALYVAIIVAYDYATPGGNNAPAFMAAGINGLFSYGLIWFMASTSAITTACYRLTGSIWTGAFVNAMYCACSLLSAVPITVNVF